MAIDGQLFLVHRQGFATSHAQLPLHQIKARNGLGDRVLHLQARVHLHKKEIHHTV